VNEKPFFFRIGTHQLFAVLHRPPSGTARCGVVLCSALAEEKLWSHRVYVNAARELASERIAVLRFDFRGEGDSDREFEDGGLETRAADALRAAEVLLENEPSLRGCFFLGHRLGCAPAAIAAARFGERALGLVAWDPVARGSSYLMQWLRSVLAAELAQTGRTATRASLIKRLDAGETIIADGYGIGPALYRDLMALEWPQLLGEVACPVVAIDGSCEPPFWRESKRFHTRAPVMSARTLEWLQAAAA
jgi:alpha/beta superfamily hydrolase